MCSSSIPAVGSGYRSCKPRPSSSAIPSAVDPPSGERAGSGAAMNAQNPAASRPTLAAPVTVCSACLGRWRAGGQPPSRSRAPPPEALEPQLPSPRCGRPAARGGPQVQSAAGRAGTVAPRLRGALIQNRSIRQFERQRERQRD
jgi:hypothetical protein